MFICKPCNKEFNLDEEFKVHEKTTECINARYQVHLDSKLIIHTFHETDLECVGLDGINQAISNSKIILDNQDLNMDAIKEYFECLINIFQYSNFHLFISDNHNCRILNLGSLSALVGENFEFAVLGTDPSNGHICWYMHGYMSFMNEFFKLMKMLSIKIDNERLNVMLEYLDLHLINNDELKKEMQEHIEEKLYSVYRRFQFVNDSPQIQMIINSYRKKKY